MVVSMLQNRWFHEAVLIAKSNLMLLQRAGSRLPTRTNKQVPSQVLALLRGYSPPSLTRNCLTFSFNLLTGCLIVWGFFVSTMGLVFFPSDVHHPDAVTAKAPLPSCAFVLRCISQVLLVCHFP